MKITVIVLILNLFIIKLLLTQTYSYFINNETPPGNDPIVYGNGIISKHDFEEISISFSSAGDELVFSRLGEGIYYMKSLNGKWGAPELE